jgi:hypothetical protein
MRVVVLAPVEPVVVVAEEAPHSSDGAINR